MFSVSFSKYEIHQRLMTPGEERDGVKEGERKSEWKKAIGQLLGFSLLGSRAKEL